MSTTRKLLDSHKLRVPSLANRILRILKAMKSYCTEDDSTTTLLLSFPHFLNPFYPKFSDMHLEDVHETKTIQLKYSLFFSKESKDKSFSIIIYHSFNIFFSKRRIQHFQSICFQFNFFFMFSKCFKAPDNTHSSFYKVISNENHLTKELLKYLSHFSFKERGSYKFLFRYIFNKNYRFFKDLNRLLFW